MIIRTVKVDAKPRKCVQCGQATVVKILYGEPTEKAAELEMKGKLVIGGCILTEMSATWECISCHTEYIKIK